MTRIEYFALMRNNVSLEVYKCNAHQLDDFERCELVAELDKRYQEAYPNQGTVKVHGLD